jgi:hypothetical protein
VGAFGFAAAFDFAVDVASDFVPVAAGSGSSNRAVVVFGFALS